MKSPAPPHSEKPDTLKNAQSNISNHGDVISNHNAMVTNSATSGQSCAQTSSAPINSGPSSTRTTTGQSYIEKPGGVSDMVNSTDAVNWFQIPDTPNCGMATDSLGAEILMTDSTSINNTDSMVTDTSQLFAATYQVLEGEEDGILSANQHGFYDHNKPQASQAPSGTQMNQAHYQNSVTNSQNQSSPHHSMPATCSTGTGNIPNPNSNLGPQHPPHSSVHNIPTKPPEPPKLAHRNPHNPLTHRPTQPPYPGMWPNQARVPGPPHNRPPGVGNMPPYGSPGPPQPRSFPPNYPIRSEATQATKSFENQFSDFIKARHGNPFPHRCPNMQDPSRPQMQSPNSAQNFQSPNVTMNKFQNVNRYPFHQLGPASGAIRDLACRVPTPQFPRGPPMMQGNVGHQPLQHPPQSAQAPYGQGPLPPQGQQQQQGYLGPTHPQWSQSHGNIPLNQHQMMSQRHSAQTPPHSQAQNFHPQQQQQQLMQTAVRNEGSPVPQIASPSLSQQAISNIPPIDPPPIQHRTTPDKPSTPKKKKSPKISRESTQESVKIQEEKALLENPHANVHIGHPKGKKCKFHRTKNSKDKYTVFGCRACNVALCKECHDEYHNELSESHQQK